jgi:hypothetical protein
MIWQAGFSERDWELAPMYESPTAGHGVVTLEFDKLSELAAKEKNAGSFRTDKLGRLSIAPLYVDGLPAAFYEVKTKYPEFSSNINTSSQETIVVMDGVMKLIFNDETPDDGVKFQSLADTLLPGQVRDLQDRSIALQAVGVFDVAHCLALALYRDRDIQVQPVLN